jgi:alpha-tubulin suppressor-like RCC1 family protein
MSGIGLCVWARWAVMVFGFAISIGVSHSAASGFLIGWGNRNDATILPDDVTNIVSAAAGTEQSLWLRADGTVRFQGHYPFQGAAAGASALSNVAAISLGYRHALALLSNGTVVAWGDDPAGDNALAAGISNATAIAAGGYFNLVVADGKVMAWGENRFGQLDVPSGLSNVVAVSASQTYNSAHCLALKSDGTVVAWGDQFFGQTAVPAGLSNVTAISAGWYHSVALKSDGTVVAWGGDNPSTRAVPAGLSNVVAISAGAWQTLALRSDHTIVSWPSRLDIGPVPESFTNAIAISAGQWHNLAVFADGAPRLLTVQQPAAVYAGSESSFWVTVAGVGPFSYRWHKDGVDLPGENDNLLYLSDVQPPDEGDYNVTVSNPFGSVSTEPRPLTTVPAAVEIWKHPVTTFTYEGSYAAFEVLARGSLPISYQWYERISQASAIPGATGASLTVSNVTGLQTRYYFVVVSNAYSSDSVTSKVATLTVRPAQLAISRQPRGDNVFIGASVKFTVGVDGVPPLFYQWRKNGDTLANETNSTLTLQNVGTADAGVYSVIVSNQVGSVTSADATLTIHSYSLPPTSPPGTVVNLSGALLPPGLTNIIAIAAGRFNALAVRDNGTVELVPGGWVLPGLANVVAVAAGRFDAGYGLSVDGTVARWSGGSAPEPSPAAGVFGVVSIAASDHGGFGLKSDGRVVSLDSGEFLPGISNAVAIAAGLALQADGSIVVFAGPLLPPYQQYNPPSDAIAVAVGPGFIALTADGTVVQFGASSTPVPTGLSNVVAISGGYGNALALKSDSTVIGWGRINISQHIDNVSALAAGGRYSLVLTTNPPPPVLAVVKNGDQCELLAPVAVSGYVLECTEDLSQPFTPITVVTNAADLSGPNMGLILPPEGRAKIFRLRKL